MGSPYKRVVIKISGNALFNFDGSAKEIETDDLLTNLLTQLKTVQQQGVQVAVVFGGGNICRGKQMAACGVKRTTADNIGMLATVINSLIIRERLTKMGCPCVLMTAFPVGNMTLPFEPFQAIRDLEQGNVVICAGGTGNPFVTTDTASSLRCIQVEADALIKLTKVNGVYDKDPNKFADAKLFRSLSYDYVLEHQLAVMDLSAFNQCKIHSMPIHVANYREADVITRIVNGGTVGTIISREAMGDA
jgi:uridylate kinase